MQRVDLCFTYPRPLIQLLNQMNFMEIVFTIDSSQFKDTHTLSDNVFEGFRQVSINSYSVCA